MYSNKVTTVSPIYAADLLTEQFGYDMHLALNTHKYVQFLIFTVRMGNLAVQKYSFCDRELETTIRLMYRIKVRNLIAI